jgi:hypothetical protein
MRSAPCAPFPAKDCTEAAGGTAASARPLLRTLSYNPSLNPVRRNPFIPQRAVPPHSHRHRADALYAKPPDLGKLGAEPPILPPSSSLLDREAQARSLARGGIGVLCPICAQMPGAIT